MSSEPWTIGSLMRFDRRAVREDRKALPRTQLPIN